MTAERIPGVRLASSAHLQWPQAPIRGMPAVTISQQPKYSVGIIGCGRKGTQTARSYARHPLTTVVAAADPDPDNLALFCERFQVPGFRGYEEMLANEQIDIAAPILPVSENPAVVLGCARAGVRAISCEKPMSASLAEADKMVEACAARGIKFGVGDLDRNLPHYQEAARLLASGELGEVVSIAALDGSGHEMSGGGIQRYSLMRLFAGDGEVEWVTGWVTDDPTSDNDQGGAGHVRFANGIEGLIHRQPSARQGYEVLCSRGVFVSDNAHVHAWKLADEADRPSADALRPVEGVLPGTHVYRGRTARDAEGWRIMPRQDATTQSMVDALEQDIEPRANGDNGRKALELAIAIRESHRRGHTPVRLPLEDRNLKIIPGPGRWGNKKEVYGSEWYAEQIGDAVRR